MRRSEYHGVVFYQFENLSRRGGLVHGVFSRRGGVSAPPFDTLNVGSTVGDDLANVLINRQRMAEALGMRDEDMRTVWQVHGADVVVIRGRGPQEWPPPQADGILTREIGLPLVMRFADCVPILLYDPVQRVAGIAHAGWRGTVAGAGAATVRTMCDAFGSRPADILAAIGPSIGPCCYEVGEEVVAQIREVFGDREELFHAANGKGPRLDLWAANRLALEQAGVEQIEVAGICTACRKDEFFSHRAEAGRTGRFGVVIMLKEEAV